jgi:hypothetical protein
MPRLPDSPRAPGLHVSEPWPARASGSVLTLDAPMARSASVEPRGFSAASGASSMFAHFEPVAPDGQAPSHLRARP